MERIKAVIKTSTIGIIGNVFLAVFKLIVGIAANSIAVTMDAVNNISDAMSSVITLMGIKLSIREPDRAHPFGYGRLEAMSALLIGIMILYAGAMSFKESILRIINPETADYTTETFVVMIAAIIIKIVIGHYIKRKGTELDSEALKASGRDSLDDAIVTAATLAAALIFIYSGVSIEAYVGAAISLLIIRTGILTLRATVSELLGERVSADLAESVRKSILSFPEVEGVYDIVIHSYGRQKLLGSAHIEVPEVLRASWIDNLQRAITDRVYKDTGVEMLGVSIYAVNTTNEKIIEIREAVRSVALKTEHVLQMHGFYLDEIDSVIKFDIVVSFDAPDRAAIGENIRKKVEERYPGYDVHIVIDNDIV